MAFWFPQSDSSDPNKFGLLASPKACVGPAGYEFIMGGVAQAAAIEAAENLPTSKICSLRISVSWMRLHVA